MLIHLRHSSEFDRFDEGRTRARILGEVATGMYPGEPWGPGRNARRRGLAAVRGNSELTCADVRAEAHAAWQVAKLEREGHLSTTRPSSRLPDPSEPESEDRSSSAKVTAAAAWRQCRGLHDRVTRPRDTSTHG